MFNDEVDDSEIELKGLFSETRFTDIEQNVEKSVIDLFGSF